MNNIYNYDVFISHASEDKDSFVRPLAEKLKTEGVRVWYDEFSLTVGDRLTVSINAGLKDSRYGIVVFSNNFFEKQWTIVELSALQQKALSQEKVILPILYNISHDEFKNIYPLFSDIVSISADRDIDEIVKELVTIFSKSLKNETDEKEENKVAMRIAMMRYMALDELRNFYSYVQANILIEEENRVAIFKSSFKQEIDKRQAAAATDQYGSDMFDDDAFIAAVNQSILIDLKKSFSLIVRSIKEKSDADIPDIFESFINNWESEIV
jgi:hypothetical protein